MNNAIKLGLYVVFAVGAIISVSLFHKTYKRLNSDTPKQEARAQTVAATNAAATNALATNTATASTNLAVTSTNQTNVAVQANADSGSLENIDAPLGTAKGRSKNFAPLITYTGVFFMMVIGFALLAANDISHYMGSRALKTLYNDDGEGLKTPEYELAEQTWADGKHLEALGLMREYLKKNPKEIHVALRIAEIYEKDLNNHLAAALEYEEVLKHKLSADRWAWAAIHLCNLYFKLGQNGKGIDLLKRIDAEYGETPAAEKARKRLAQLVAEGVLPPEEATTTPISSPEVADAPASKLPPGFGPRKS
jgi:hypothetical protein